ncbi:MAG: hypothetical protein ABSF54_23330, partial [Bryobacteraceae bacterium]
SKYKGGPTRCLLLIPRIRQFRIEPRNPAKMHKPRWLRELIDKRARFASRDQALYTALNQLSMDWDDPAIGEDKQDKWKETWRPIEGHFRDKDERCGVRTWQLLWCQFVLFLIGFTTFCLLMAAILQRPKIVQTRCTV